MSVTISAAMVKELRERTGAAMMDCKRALEGTGGKIEEAIDALRKSGAAKAIKKSGRIAAEGIVAVADENKHALLIEINSETDFVARDANFLAFVEAAKKTALANNVADVAALASATIPGDSRTLEEARQELVAKVGENVQVRRLVMSHASAGSIGTYLHGNRIGVLVELDIDDTALARDIAMHIAASKPLVVSPDQVPADLIAKEKEIYAEQSASSGKPAEIIEKMVAGKLKKYLDEVSLIGQPFVKDPETTVGNLLAKQRAKVIAFHRYEVGEGIEKVTEDFAEAVMAQAKQS